MKQGLTKKRRIGAAFIMVILVSMLLTCLLPSAALADGPFWGSDSSYGSGYGSSNSSGFGSYSSGYGNSFGLNSSYGSSYGSSYSSVPGYRYGNSYDSYSLPNVSRNRNSYSSGFGSYSSNYDNSFSSYPRYDYRDRKSYTTDLLSPFNGSTIERQVSELQRIVGTSPWSPSSLSLTSRTSSLEKRVSKLERHCGLGWLSFLY